MLRPQKAARRLFQLSCTAFNLHLFHIYNPPFCKRYQCVKKQVDYLLSFNFLLILIFFYMNNAPKNTMMYLVEPSATLKIISLSEYCNFQIINRIEKILHLLNHIYTLKFFKSTQIQKYHQE